MNEEWAMKKLPEEAVGRETEGGTAMGELRRAIERIEECAKSNGEEIGRMQQRLDNAGVIAPILQEMKPRDDSVEAETRYRTPHARHLEGLTERLVRAADAFAYQAEHLAGIRDGIEI